MKRTFALLICLIMCISFASCKEAEGNTSSMPKKSAEPVLKSEEISLLYYSGDSFNPYVAKTKHNREISRLIYDPLIKYDNEFNPVYCLASKAVLSGKSCKVTELQMRHKCDINDEETDVRAY